MHNEETKISIVIVILLILFLLFSSTNSFNPTEASLPDVEKVSTQVPPLDLNSRTHSFSNDGHHSGMELQYTEGESKLSSPKNDSEGTSSCNIFYHNCT